MWTIYERLKLGIIPLRCPYQFGAVQVTFAVNVCNTDSSTKFMHCLKPLFGICIYSFLLSVTVYMCA